jgi:hypothetical protein
MNVKTIGLRGVDADPGVGDLRGQLEQLLEVEIAGIDRSLRAALNQVGTTLLPRVFLCSGCWIRKSS